MSTLSPGEFRSRFPVLARRIYLNSCSQGALSVDAERALGRFVDSWHADGSPWEHWVGIVETLRARFAAAIGADGDEVAVMPSASVAISAVASALTFAAPRDGVVMGEFEFPTMAHVWLAQQRRGARIAWAPASGEELPLEAYQHLVDDRTLLVPATHICFRNGFRVDLAGLARLCHDRGAYLFLDDYQHTGSGPLDVRALGVDFMVTGALKYLLGPSGIAYLYVRREIIERLEPTVTGWFGRANPFAFAADRLDWADSARRFETGTPPVPNAYGALAGLDLLERVGFENVRRRVAALVRRCIELAAAAGYDVLTPADPARRGALVVLRSTDAPTLASRLHARGIICSARGSGLRISFHAYNDEEDIRALFEALERESALLTRTGPVARPAGTTPAGP